MTDKEIKLELAKAALRGGQDVRKAVEAFGWVTYEKEPCSKNLDEELVAELEDAMGKNAVRFRNRCRENGIVTVGQLVKFGSNGFRGMRTVGDGLVSYISEALKEKYGIEKW